ncbi:type II and III secretion system protein family protein [Aurantiacibacter marinus]|uniref:Pilus assembly protein CpaC n=1 Tax=Aurantiacibacter marinus TaxID=874156 RepID=A0A0H0XP86_9SPHN|nr:type II and III secretion system protein family protein [Aurantiacibacter marinus]KLI64398.1 pilus assembly protein CpaC [Aurantiacibacter marinus]
MIKAKTLVAFAAVCALFGAVPAAAQYETDYGLHAGELIVPINKSQVVTTSERIERAMVGNADIADVLPISERSIYVLGKSMGTTSLTLYDRNNRVIAVMDVSVGPDVDGMRRQLQELMPDQPIEVGLSNGSLVLSGTVNDPGAADRAARLATAFAGGNVINLLGMGASQQVMLEVRFAEVSRTVGEQLGVGGFGNSSSGDFSAAIGQGANASAGTNGTTDLGIGSITDAFGVFGALFELGDLSVEAYLDTLERNGLSRTLAEPTLVALSGESASFLAGGEFPVPVSQGGNDGNNAITVLFKPFGVSLAFTPTVLGNGVINLIVEPEVSSIDPSASVTVNGLTVPGLQTRRARTTLEVRDGESFAIAGLLRDETQTTVNQLPILGSLPIIGSLFRSSSYQRGETELLIVVTPRLVQPIRPDQVRLPTDRVPAPSVPDVLLNGDIYQPQELAPSAPAPQTDQTGGTGYEY